MLILFFCKKADKVMYPLLAKKYAILRVKVTLRKFKANCQADVNEKNYLHGNKAMYTVFKLTVFVCLFSANAENYFDR